MFTWIIFLIKDAFNGDNRVVFLLSTFHAKEFSNYIKKIIFFIHSQNSVLKENNKFFSFDQECLET